MTRRRIPHCAHWGAFWATVEDGRIVAVEPFEQDPAPSPILESVKEWLDPAVRIERPMVREGWLAKREGSDRSGRGRDRFVPVSWDEAERLVGGEIDRVRHTFGNDSIFAGSYGWTSAGRFHHAQSQVRRLFNQVGGYTAHRDTYSVGAGAVIGRHVFGGEAEFYGQGVTLDAVAEHTELMVACGALSPRTAQVEAGGIGRHMLETYLKKFADRGGRAILVSPRRDDAPASLNAEWWPILPNTDTALLIGLAGQIVADGRADADFLGRCCSGSDEFLAYLKGQPDGTPKNAAWAAGITGLEAHRIRALAADLVRRRSFITISWALQRAVFGEQPWWAGVGLASVMGQIGLPGGGIAFGFGSTGGTGAPPSLTKSPAIPQGTKPNASFIPVARIADMLLNPKQPFTYEGKTHTYPDTRMVFWAGGNPFHHHQDLHRLTRAWEQPETIVVQEPLWTPTARRADIVLPASTSLERNDISGGRRADLLVAMHKVVEPFGQARSDHDILRGIAARIGVEEAFTEGRDEMGWLRHLYAGTAEDARTRLGFDMPDFDTFWDQGWTPVPQRRDYVHLADFRADPDAKPLKTESGRIVLYSRTLAGLGYEDCPPHPTWMEPPEWAGAPEARKYPFHLITAQPQTRLHSQLDFAKLSRADKVGGREAMLLNPADAAKLAIKDGDTALLWNDRGRCLAGVRISDDVRPGVAVLPTGAWFTPLDTADGVIDNAGNSNVLTLDRGSSAFSGGCSAHTCLVAIERYTGNVAPPPATSLPVIAAE